MDPIQNAYEVADRQGWFIVGAYRRAATPRWGTSVTTAICLLSRLATESDLPRDSWRVAEIRSDEREFGQGDYTTDRKAAFDRWLERTQRAEQDIAIYNEGR